VWSDTHRFDEKLEQGTGSGLGCRAGAREICNVVIRYSGYQAILVIRSKVFGPV